MTVYVILHQDQPGPDWEELGQTDARSQRAAIQQAIESPTGAPPKNGGRFQAVPARSWKPVTVKVETKTALKFS